MSSISSMPRPRPKSKTPHLSPAETPRGTLCHGRTFRTFGQLDSIPITTWNPKQPFINGCFNWMIPNLYIENGCFTKHPFINGCLGFQELEQCFKTLQVIQNTWPNFIPNPLEVTNRRRFWVPGHVYVNSRSPKKVTFSLAEWPGTDCFSFQDPFVGLWFIIPCSIFPPLHQKKFGTKTAQLLPTRKKPIKKKHQTIDHEKSPRKTPTEPRKNADRVATGSVTRVTSGLREVQTGEGYLPLTPGGGLDLKNPWLTCWGVKFMAGLTMGFPKNKVSY